MLVEKFYFLFCNFLLPKAKETQDCVRLQLPLFKFPSLLRCMIYGDMHVAARFISIAYFLAKLVIDLSVFCDT